MSNSDGFPVALINFSSVNSETDHRHRSHVTSHTETNKLEFSPFSQKEYYYQSEFKNI